MLFNQNSLAKREGVVFYLALPHCLRYYAHYEDVIKSANRIGVKFLEFGALPFGKKVLHT